MSITRIRRLERKLPAVDVATGFFVVEWLNAGAGNSRAVLNYLVAHGRIGRTARAA